MIKGSSKDGVFVDTGLLRDHVSKLREQKKLASELYAHVLAMKNSSDPTVSYQYNRILHDVEQLVAYFAKMSQVLSVVEEDAVQLGRQIECVIDNDTDELKHDVSKTLML